MFYVSVMMSMMLVQTRKMFCKCLEITSSSQRVLHCILPAFTFTENNTHASLKPELTAPSTGCFAPSFRRSAPQDELQSPQGLNQGCP